MAAGNLRRLIAAAVACGTFALPVAAAPALWRVSDADSSVWLFGSIHLFDRNLDWRTPTFDAALAAAERVYFEMILDEGAYATLTRLTITEGRLGNGTTLADLLTPEQFAALRSAVDAAGLDLATIEVMQPWLAEATIGGTALGAGMAGVEVLLDAEIAADRKQGLETAEQQFGFFADAPLEAQIEYLMQTVSSLGTPQPDALGELTTAWVEGDIERIDRMVNSQLETQQPLRYRSLISDRNLNWTTTIADLLASDEDAMIIVGAAHLAGEDGVPALLAERGFAVERIMHGPAPPEARGKSLVDRPPRRR